jgi:Putative lumazine-binding
MPRSRAIALASLALVPALAGCATTSTSKDSSGDFQGQQRLVANTVEDFESAAKKGDNSEICSSILARGLVDAFTRPGRSCAKSVDEAIKDSDTQDLTVQAVRVAGPTATARVKVENGDDDRIQTLTLVRQGGGWRISKFG